tara:strand:- start:842882 stop:844084 length:1203 start_codon:yes stop_codon:yes gene_type:complete
MKSKAIRWIIYLLVAGLVFAGIFYAMQPKPVEVDAGVAQSGTLRITVDEEGKTRIRERYSVSSPLVGRLRRITLDAGDAVRAQETALAVIEPTNPDLLDARALAEAEARVRAAQAAVRQAGATLESARAGTDFAENELTRITNAFKQGAANKHELDSAQTAQRTAIESHRAAQYGQEITEYELEVAQSALLYAKGESDATDQARMVLTSPIDGVVLRVLQESVAVVNPGTPLIEIGDPLDLEIVIDVLSTDAVGIRPGQRIIIEHWGGDAPLEARVRLVEPSAFTKTSALGIDEQRVNVIADFVTPEASRTTLGDGFRVEASIIVWEEPDILHVPTSAIFRTAEHWTLFRIVDKQAQLTNIEIGKQNGTSTQVLSGLSESNQVVLHPSDQITDGVLVTVR